MDIAVVIKCSDDQRIFRCIQSIPKEIETVCSITPNIDTEQKLSKMKISYVITPKGNLGFTTTSGIKLTKSNNVIIMDADCYFEKGAIAALYKALKQNLIVKGKIIFLHNDSLISKTITELRDFVNQQPVAYTPGLAFRKELKNFVGEIFNPNISWAEDAELDYRIKEAGIKIKIINRAIIYHDPVSIRYDLRAAFRIGQGKRLIVELTNKYNEEDFVFILKNIVSGRYFKEFSKILRHKGYLVLFYSFLWNIFYYCGYYLKKVCRKLF